MPIGKAPGTEKTRDETIEKFKEEKQKFLGKISTTILDILETQALLKLDQETQAGIVYDVRRKLVLAKDCHGGLEQFNREFNSIDHWVPAIKRMILQAVSQDEDVKNYFELRQ